MKYGGHELEMWGELVACRTCGGGEGSLPTECPGVRMTPAEEGRVYAAVLDFVDGAWKSTPRPGLLIRMTSAVIPGCPLGAVERWLPNPD